MNHWRNHVFESRDFDRGELRRGGPGRGSNAVVDFWAPWCPPCRALAPTLEALAEERLDVVVGKLDVDDHSSIAERYGIRSIPTVLIFRNGELAARSVGLVSLGRLRDLLADQREEATA